MAHLSDDDDDAWSYSFPPSTESLPLTQDTAASSAPAQPAPAVTPESKITGNGPRPVPPANGPMASYGLQVESLRKGDTEDVHSQASSTSSSNGISAAELRKNRLSALAPISRTSSRSSASLQSPFLVKATPANPLTTKQDASSIISKDNLASGFEASLSTSSNTARSSLLHNKSNSTGGHELLADADGKTEPSSPKIITYRKTKGRSVSESYPESPTTPKALDPSLYSDETFRDTPFHYAAMKRNTEFHQLFRALDLTDRLLDDFSCALSREILLQGRIYVSEHYVCFNSNLLGWVTNLVIKFEDIVKFERKTTAGLFPNGISIETKDTKHNFASFLSRDVTYDFMTAVWSKSRGEHIDTLGVTQEELIQQKREKQQEEVLNKTPKIESYIMSIDGDDGDDENEDVSEGELQEGSNGSRAIEEVSTKLLKFKPESKYKNSGPDIHTPTDASTAFSKEVNEVELCNEVIDAPMGIVFDIMFGSSNTSFHKRLLELHDGSEITEYDEFLPMQEDPTRLERTYTYRKALGYSIGPKSTKCEVSEIIEHQNFTDYVMLLTSTVTPDVPSGQAFSVKTRYVLTWAEEGKTNLVLSFFISWTGRSWIKGVIEKQSLAGQKEVAKSLIEELKQEIAAATYYVDGPTVIKEIEPVKKVTSEITITPEKEKIELNPTTGTKDKDWISSNKITLYAIGYFFISILGLLLISQLRILRVLKETNELTKSQVVLNNHLIQTLAKNQIGYDDHENQFWEWVFKAYGKKLSRIEKIQFLSYQLNKLSQEDPKSTRKKVVNPPSTKKAEDTFGDIKQKVEGLNYHGSLYVEDIRDMLGDLL